MKKVLNYLLLFAIIPVLHSCTKTESDFTATSPETIVIKSNASIALIGDTVTFTVSSSINSAIVTNESKVYVNGTLITGNTYAFSQEGTYAVFATKGTLNSNVLSIQVNNSTQPTTGFLDRVLVEEYSGTWCGNCPSILYAVDLLHQQTDNAIVVSTHLFNGDPFITAQGNSLAASLGITGVPAGYINRTTSWTGPQYENVNQVINQMQPIETLGLAISSVITGNNLNATIKVSYKQSLIGNAKLTVYLVEDKLNYTQRNYSSTLYSGQANIPNFEYNGVIRSVVSDLAGDAIANTGTDVEKTYSIPLPSNISNIANVRLVAFVTNESGTVVNAQEAGAGTTKDFETL